MNIKMKCPEFIFLNVKDLQKRNWEKKWKKIFQNKKKKKDHVKFRVTIKIGDKS